MKLKLTLLLFNILLVLPSFSQEGTRNTKEVALPDTVGKLMLIPFDPIMYMSEIDRKVNQETNWNFNQIREYFRHQLDNQLQFKLNRLTPVVTFYKDSSQKAKDLNYIYQSTTTSYDLVDGSKETTSEKPKGIQNGQVVVEINDDKKFMNKKIVDPELIPYLQSKYNVNYLVFINELDIKNDMNSYDLVTDSYERTITVHYTIIDKYAKTIAAGVATTNFSSKINSPKKIVNQSFTEISSQISDVFSASFSK